MVQFTLQTSLSYGGLKLPLLFKGDMKRYTLTANLQH